MGLLPANRRQVIWRVIAVIACIALLLGWFRIRSRVVSGDQVMIHVVREEETPNSFEIEYRTHLPFYVRVTHSIGKRWTPPKTPGVHVGSTKSHKTEVALDVPARYDWIHGDYYFLLRVDSSHNLLIDANGQAFDVPIWSDVPASSARFGTSGMRVNGRRLGGGHRLGSGVGSRLVTFDVGDDEEETLVIYPTLDQDLVPRPVR